MYIYLVKSSDDTELAIIIANDIEQCLEIFMEKTYVGQQIKGYNIMEEYDNETKIWCRYKQRYLDSIFTIHKHDIVIGVID